MEFDVVIGLEVHCQLNTATKIFASDSNAFGEDANTNLGVLTLAHPGVLPRINKEVVRSAVKLGLAIDSKINRNNYFDRKNYFYPDLPKGYQVTQDAKPVCIGGVVKFLIKEGKKFVTHEVKVHHIHMEEDAGKSIHTDTGTLLDYNRAGSPLLEIVSYPCINSPEEAAGYLAEIRKIVRFLGISDGNMEEGSLRADLNVSLKPKGSEELGTKVEIKNMNSIRFLQKAAEFEVKRQTEILKDGGTVIQETRGFAPETGETFSQRVKETANDYRYFPEPDLAPIHLSEKQISDLKDTLPQLSYDLFFAFISKYELTEENAYLISEDRGMSEYFLGVSQHTKNYKAASNWIVSNIRGFLNESGGSFETFSVKPSKLAELITAIDNGSISNSAAQTLMEKLIDSPEANLLQLAESNGLLQTSDVGSWVDEVLENNKSKVEEFKKGKKGLLGMFVGEVMKLSKGSADPKEVNKVLLDKLK